MSRKKNLCILIFCLTVFAFQTTPPLKPKLVIGIIIDQIRFDYLTRFEPYFEEGGFKRLMNEGAYFSNAYYPYAGTFTGPGHATYLSGTLPSVHGIVSNDFFDRETGKFIYCVFDSTAQIVGSGTLPAGKVSPRNFWGSNLADELRISDQSRSKVISIAFKDRSAILPGGKNPTGVYWFDAQEGVFVTSSYYTNQLPRWVEDFNAKGLPKSFIGKVWERLLPADSYQPSTADNTFGEGTITGDLNNQFPHTFNLLKDGKRKPYDSFVTFPFSNEVTLELAKSAIVNEKLGEDTFPDLLSISLSGLDYAGHVFGPNSQEVEDFVLRLDRQLAEFFRWLDQQVGVKNVDIVLTADHGVAMIPEVANLYKLGGGKIKTKEIRSFLNQALAQKYGEGKFISHCDDGEILLDQETLKKKNLDETEVERVTGEIALLHPGISSYYTRTQLLNNEGTGEIGKLVQAGFHPKRSADVILIPKPFYIFHDSETGTTHGTPYEYDRHVPLIFLGNSFNPGKYANSILITDIVPTFCEILKIEKPSGAMGRVLTEILK
jgi:predicted AlkP superfamily pyrophosphatase or phosphodiesterase